MQRGTRASAFARARSGDGSFNVPVTFYPWTMRFTLLRTPKVDKLAQARDVAGLLEAAGHGGAEIRKAAASGLAEIGPSDGLPAVIEALRHPSDRVRCAAIRVLCEWREPMPLAEAVAWLPPAGWSRQLALAAIAQLDEPHSAPTLTRSLVRGNAQEGLWEDEVEVVWNLCDSTKLHDALDGVIDLLLEALGDERDDIAARASIPSFGSRRKRSQRSPHLLERVPPPPGRCGLSVRSAARRRSTR